MQRTRKRKKIGYRVYEAQISADKVYDIARPALLKPELFAEMICGLE